MKKLMMMLVTAMFVTAAVQAQDAESAKPQRTPEEKAKMMTQHMDKKLDLTDAQEARILAINTDFVRRKAELKQNNGNDKEAMRQHMQALRANTDSQIKAVLTPEQWAKREQMKAERKEKHGKHHERKGKHGKKGQNKQ